MYRLIDNDLYHLNNCDCTKISNNNIKVLGRGTINAAPDSAEILVGVITDGKVLSETQEKNSMITSQVIKSINRIGILPKDIQTQNYNVRLIYDYVDGRQILKGYEVNNYLKITIKNIDDVGIIIDTAVENGANSISDIKFIVSDASKYYYEALKLAVEDAKKKAKVIANEFNIKLNDTPIVVNEQNTGLAVPLSYGSFKTSNMAVPIEAGENKISADIEAVFIYE